MSLNVPTKKEPVLIESSYELKQRDFERQLHIALQAADFADIDSVRHELLVFDLSKTYWYDLGVLLWFISLLNRLKRQENDLHLIFPEPNDSVGRKVWSFLIRWRFFETLSACVDDPINLLSPDQIQYVSMESEYGFGKATDRFGQENILHNFRILEITTMQRDQQSGEEQNPLPLGVYLQRFSGQIILSALSQLCGWDPSLTKTFVRRIVREGVYNSLHHSQGTFANMSMRLDERNLVLAISDNGIGIPSVLRNTFRSSSLHKRLLAGSDSDLIKYFTEPEVLLDSRLIKLSTEKGVSSEESRKGLGLYYLKSIVLGQGGELRIRSGRALVDFTESNTSESDDLHSSPGTTVRVVTPLKPQ